MRRKDVGAIIQWYGNKYKISDLPICDGDYIWCENSEALDKCIATFSDGTAVVEFRDGARGVFHLSHFQKAVKP